MSHPAELPAGQPAEATRDGARRTRQRGALDLRGGLWSLRLRERVGPESARTWRTRRLPVGPASRLRTRAMARLAADRLLEREGMLSTRASSASITFAELAAIYEGDHIASMAVTSQEAVRSVVRRWLVPTFGTLELRELEGRRPADLVAAMRAAGLARSSVRRAVATLGRMLELGQELGYAAPLLNRRAIRLPPALPSAEPRYFAPEETARILAAAEMPWRALWALLAYTGARASEVLGLAWEAVDLEAGVIRIRQAAVVGKIRATKSSNSAADLPMAAELAEILRELKATTPKATGLLFPSPRTAGPRWRGAVQRRHLAPLLRRLGIAPAGLHAWRHAVATLAFRGGASAPTARALLRHGSINTTLRYSHVTGADLQQAVAAVAAQIAQAAAYAHTPRPDATSNP